MEEQIKILVAEDDANMQRAMHAALSKSSYHITTVANGREAIEKLEEQQFNLVISDQRMPEITGVELLRTLKGKGTQVPFIMVTAHGTITQAVEAMQEGASDFITKPFEHTELQRVVERVLATYEREGTQEVKRTRRGRPIITNDPLMIRVLEVAEAVARSDATVLVQGESGTGKELIARLIHTSSTRSEQPFVAVNCAALPDTLLESELFGHEKGAFTGAQQRKLGKFELAHGGTILLDEISEMALPLQAKLLRVLQEREVDRVGGKDPIAIDVRVVATTNRNLEESVRRGEFRADLYYRLNVIPLTLPPLRERRSDIKLLVKHFMNRYLGDGAPELSPEVIDALVHYPWPGNIRELQNAVERAAILSRGTTPKESDFLLTAKSPGSLKSEITIERNDTNSIGGPTPREIGDELAINYGEGVKAAPTEQGAISGIRSGLTVAEVEKALILETLRTTSYNRTQAAKMLGISIRTLRNKLNEYRGAGEVIEGAD